MRPADMIFGGRQLAARDLGDGTIEVIHITPMFGENSMVLPISVARLQEWATSGKLIQDVFPDLDASQREFLVSGCTPEKWKQIMGGSMHHSDVAARVVREHNEALKDNRRLGNGS